VVLCGGLRRDLKQGRQGVLDHVDPLRDLQQLGLFIAVPQVGVVRVPLEPGGGSRIDARLMAGKGTILVTLFG
jgi:hypothetical protein